MKLKIYTDPKEASKAALKDLKWALHIRNWRIIYKPNYDPF